MVGDGLNDLIALKNADIGIATDNADKHSKSAADVIINGEGLLPVLHFFNNSRDTMITLKQNFGMSLLYNLGVMAFTTTVALSLGPVAPGVMAFLMALQSILVLGNTYRLKQQPLQASSIKLTTNSKPATNNSLPLTNDFKIMPPNPAKKACCQKSKTVAKPSETRKESEHEIAQPPTNPLII